MKSPPRPMHPKRKRPRRVEPPGGASDWRAERMLYFFSNTPFSLRVISPTLTVPLVGS